jgi:mannose-1-phosphate guanylyltransferase
VVPLRNKRYVQYMVDTLRAAGLDGAVFSMGYLPEPMQNYFADKDLDGFSLDGVSPSAVSFLCVEERRIPE